MVSVRERLDSPAIRRAIAPVSLVLIGLGVIVLVASLFGGSGSAPPPPNPGAAAQGDLRSGIAAAQTFFNQQHPHTYDGFTPATAGKIDSGVTWNKGPSPSAGQVTIKSSGKAGVLLLSQASSGSTIYCIAQTPDGQTMGTKLAVKPSDCIGGW